MRNFADDVGFSEIGQGIFGLTDNFGSRLREERLRIDPHQGDFAAKIGVRRSLLSTWETGGSGIKLEQLALLAGAGIDILYVVTGQRGGELLPPDESRLLQSYRHLDDETKLAASQIIYAAAANLDQKRMATTTHAPARLHTAGKGYRSSE